jgi:hypothetical protein
MNLEAGRGYLWTDIDNENIAIDSWTHTDVTIGVDHSKVTIFDQDMRIFFAEFKTLREEVTSLKQEVAILKTQVEELQDAPPACGGTNYQRAERSFQASASLAQASESLDSPR